MDIAIHEFKDKITNAINESHLPLCVVNEIFINFATQISALAEQEYNQKIKTEKGGQNANST